MENKNTIELNVVRLGGGNGGSQPTKLSELENDTSYISNADGMLEIPIEPTNTYLTESNNFTANVGLISYADITFNASSNPTGEGITSTIYNGDIKLAEYIAESNQTILYHVRTDKIQVYKVVYGSLESLGDIECNTPIDLKITSSLTNFDVGNGPSSVRVENAKGIKNTKESIAMLNEKISTKADKTEIADMATKTEIKRESYLSKFDYVLFNLSLFQSGEVEFTYTESCEVVFQKDEFIFNFELLEGDGSRLSLYHWDTDWEDWRLVDNDFANGTEVSGGRVPGTDYQYYINQYYPDKNKWKMVFIGNMFVGDRKGKYEIVSIDSKYRIEAALDLLNKNKADKNDLETYVLNFNVADGINTGSYSEDDYNALRAAIEAGKLIIVAGSATRVTADSQAMADDYVVIRYSTPRISDDNTSVTLSVYELKFGLLNTGDTEYTYSSKAIHKTIS
ncbi:MAG: hypothetical protein IJ352_06660 [Muribaculaceae bacterium]|nr:hypothetical protein [Muribaculaceae bacterium]